MASCFQKWKQGAIGSSRRAGFDGGLDQSLRKMSVLPGLRSFQSQMQLPKEIETDWLPPACPFSLHASF